MTMTSPQEQEPKKTNNSQLLKEVTKKTIKQDILKNK
jgi:hypothetical protein